MLISVLSYRRFDQTAETVVNYWTVSGGLVNIARVRWSPNGPLSAQDAAVAALEAALTELRRRSSREQPAAEFEDVPLPGL